MKTTYPLNTVLATFSTSEMTFPWTIGDSVEGLQIFGGIGSGKTTGSGNLLRKKFLNAGYGGLVLTVKADEKDAWVNSCDEAGRIDDLIVVEPGGKYHFNFLQYESKRAQKEEGAKDEPRDHHHGKGMTENIVQVLKTVLNASEEKGSRGNDKFWDSALDLLLFNVIDLCKIAYGDVSLQTMYDIVQSLPKAGVASTNSQDTAYAKAMKIAANKVNTKVKEWHINTPSEVGTNLPDEERAQAIYEAIPEKRPWDMIEQFFSQNYLTLTDKTRSIIDFSFSSFIYRLLRDPAYSLFCKADSNFSPEECRTKGKIILINLPVKTHYKVGRDCQILFKYIWQREMEREQANDYTRPVFLWADEAQNFLHEYDSEYQATARSCKIATVYISQNLPNYYAMMGGEKSEFRVKSFLGTLATKIFHANADIETNRYASDLIGEKFRDERSINISMGDDGKLQTGDSITARLQRIVRPESFANLKTGGEAYNGCVEAYIHRQGVVFGTQNYIKTAFQQPSLVKPNI